MGLQEGHRQLPPPLPTSTRHPTTLPGNLVTRSGLDLSQAAGFTVVAEKLNFFR